MVKAIAFCIPIGNGEDVGKDLEDGMVEDFRCDVNHGVGSCSVQCAAL